MYKTHDTNLYSGRQEQLDNKKKHFEDYVNLVYNLFRKQYKFEKDPEWVLPLPTECFVYTPWHIKKLQTMKADLNNTKNELDNIDLGDWSAHTRETNPTGLINKRIRDDINPEMLTRAWTKFYECAHKYKIIPNSAVQEKKLISLHLCEGPGAFVASLNHYLKTHCEDIEWNWRASTFNPYYEGNSPSNMICDDHFMFHTLDHWDFGVDETGNIMDWKNSQAIIKNVKQLGKVMLVTADGCIDCMENPEDKEDINSSLHFCEVITALQALSEDGTFVLKLFTLFEHTTINLLYLLNHFFEEVNVFKPVTSKLDNSEVYVVCLKYKGTTVSQSYMPMLQYAYGTNVYENKTLFRLEKLPLTFLESMFSCAYMFRHFQSEVICNNLDTFEQKGMSHKRLQRGKEYVSEKFIDYYKIRQIDPSQRILKGNSEVTPFLSLKPEYNQDAYAKVPYHTLTPFEKFDELKITMIRNIMEQRDHFINDVFLRKYDNCFHSSIVKYNSLELEFIIGTPVSVVNSSKFIFLPNLELYLKITTDEFRMIILDGQKRMISIDELATAPGDMCDDDPHTHHLLFPNESCEETFDMYEKQCFNLLSDQLLKLALGDDLYLSNLNLLSHFSVGLFNILFQSFEYTRFENNFRILLKNFVNPKLFSELDKISSKINSVQSKNKISSEQKTVLRILPVSQTNTGKLYDRINLYNSQLYEYKCKKYLDIIENYMAEFKTFQNYHPMFFYAP